MPDRARTALTERLLHESRRFSFFQLVKLLQDLRPGAAPLGRGGPARGEVVRFRPNASLGFPASDVERVVERPDPLGEAPARYQVTVNFFGLYGPASPMPNHFTEDLLWAGEDAESARGFLDLFHHRLVSFIYRAWEKYRYPVQYDPAAPDEVTGRLLCLLGLGTPGMLPRAGIAAPPLLRLSGMFASRRRTAVGLEAVLRDYFPGLEVRVESCRERRVRIPAESSCRLGRASGTLGAEAHLGETMRDRSGAFRLRLGPLSAARFRAFLPGSPDLDALARLVRLYVRDPLEFDLELTLRAPEVPPLRLAPDQGLPLGLMSWITPRGAEDGRARFGPRGADPLAPRPVPPRAVPESIRRPSTLETPLTTTGRR
jgi:type VI secretion system protein ImpH